MKQDTLALKRFDELTKAFRATNFIQPSNNAYLGDSVAKAPWQKWATSVLSLLQITFGESSPHFNNFSRLYNGFQYNPSELDVANAILLAAKEDYEGGYFSKLESSILGGILGDFISLAKASLSEGYKDVAAVLACAALEDALKRIAVANSIDVQDKVMQDVIAALKAKGLVGGGQKALLAPMPKLRDYAMHANWDKLKQEDVSGIIGFVEKFLEENL